MSFVSDFEEYKEMIKWGYLSDVERYLIEEAFKSGYVRGAEAVRKNFNKNINELLK